MTIYDDFLVVSTNQAATPTPSEASFIPIYQVNADAARATTQSVSSSRTAVEETNSAINVEQPAGTSWRVTRDPPTTRVFWKLREDSGKPPLVHYFDEGNSAVSAHYDLSAEELRSPTKPEVILTTQKPTRPTEYIEHALWCVFEKSVYYSSLLQKYFPPEHWKIEDTIDWDKVNAEDYHPRTNYILMNKESYTKWKTRSRLSMTTMPGRRTGNVYLNLGTSPLRAIENFLYNLRDEYSSDNGPNRESYYLVAINFRLSEHQRLFTAKAYDWQGNATEGDKTTYELIFNRLYSGNSYYLNSMHDCSKKDYSYYDLSPDDDKEYIYYTIKLEPNLDMATILRLQDEAIAHDPATTVIHNLTMRVLEEAYSPQTFAGAYGHKLTESTDFGTSLNSMMMECQRLISTTTGAMTSYSIAEADLRERLTTGGLHKEDVTKSKEMESLLNCLKTVVSEALEASNPILQNMIRGKLVHRASTMLDLYNRTMVETSHLTSADKPIMFAMMVLTTVRDYAKMLKTNYDNHSKATVNYVNTTYEESRWWTNHAVDRSHTLLAMCSKDQLHALTKTFGLSPWNNKSSSQVTSAALASTMRTFVDTANQSHYELPGYYLDHMLETLTKHAKGQAIRTSTTYTSGKFSNHRAHYSRVCDGTTAPWATRVQPTTSPKSTTPSAPPTPPNLVRITTISAAATTGSLKVHDLGGNPIVLPTEATMPKAGVTTKRTPTPKQPPPTIRAHGDYAERDLWPGTFRQCVREMVTNVGVAGETPENPTRRTRASSSRASASLANYLSDEDFSYTDSDLIPDMEGNLVPVIQASNQFAEN